MPNIKQINVNGTDYNILDVASTTTEGKVSISGQSFAGNKEFTDALIASDILVGAVGTEANGNITTTIPTAVGEDGQIMFWLENNDTFVHSVEINPTVTSGQQIGTITVDGNTSTLYAPSVDLSGYVPTTRTINGNALSSNITLTAASVGAKPTQTAVNSPSASGTSTSFISTISQNANGVITATKANMPAPYVTAQGTSNSWYYRKWSDKTYECWRSITATVNITTAWGNLYYAKISSISYPVQFTSNPYELATLHSSQDWYCMLSHGETYNTTSATCAYAAVRPSSASSVPIVLHYYARGTVSS